MRRRIKCNMPQDLILEPIGFTNYRKEPRSVTGWRTQKPVALLRADHQGKQSNEGDVVFDPFAGCSTTLVAAERHNRRWIGCELDPTAESVVRKRLSDSRQLLGDGVVDMQVLHDVPTRTDEVEDVPALVLKPKKPRERIMPRPEMLDTLIARDGLVCQGCGLKPMEGVLPPANFKRLLEIDHKSPRADGGSNAIDNRCLLCSACNRAKSDTLTLSGLRKENKKLGLVV